MVHQTIFKSRFLCYKIYNYLLLFQFWNELTFNESHYKGVVRTDGENTPHQLPQGRIWKNEEIIQNSQRNNKIPRLSSTLNSFWEYRSECETAWMYCPSTPWKKRRKKDKDYKATEMETPTSMQQSRSSMTIDSCCWMRRLPAGVTFCEVTKFWVLSKHD